MEPRESDAVAFIVDDDESVRNGIRSILRSVGIASLLFRSADEFLAAAPMDVPACIVLDVRLPGTSGLALQKLLQERDSKTPVIMISGFGDVPMSVRAIKAGALDFLVKPFRDQELIEAVSNAIEVDRARRHRARQTSELVKRWEQLTPRERQVLALVCAGHINKQIAARIGLSEITVKIYRGQLMKKMGAQSLPDLVRMSEALKP